MLYDKRWEKPEIKAAPFTLESLIAWLEKQPANKPYIWSGSNCLLCQYSEAHGVRYSKGYSKFDPALRVEIALDGEHTFGAALQRARKYAR